jgi:antitoxin component of RelBE/YafQ-DinJ toxin-antitoxin module
MRLSIDNWALRSAKNYTEIINIRITSQAKKVLEEVAKRKGLTVSDFVRLCIAKALEEELNEK